MLQTYLALKEIFESDMILIIDWREKGFHQLF